MRISTNQIQQTGIDSILSQQEKLSRTQQQVALGKRVLLPSDDPVATTQLLQLRQSMETTSQYQANADAALNRLAQEEGVLAGVTDILQSVRVLAVQANNASQTAETRRYMAAEIRQRLEELLGLANTRDGTGDYLFAGSKGSTEPFSSVDFAYAGDQNQRFLQIGPGRQVADGDPGSAVFQLVRNGNGTFVTETGGNLGGGANQGTAVIDGGSLQGDFTPARVNGENGYAIRFIQALPTDPITYEVYTKGDLTLGNPPLAGPLPYTPGQPIDIAAAGVRVTITGTPANDDTFEVRSSEYQSVFETLDALASALEETDATPAGQAQLNNAINGALSDIDQAMDSVLVVRASVGARLNAVESQVYVNEGYLLQAKGTLSSIEDLDYAEAISRLHLQMAGLEAAQQTYVKVNGLSMFNYLR